MSFRILDFHVLPFPHPNSRKIKLLLEWPKDKLKRTNLCRTFCQKAQPEYLFLLRRKYSVILRDTSQDVQLRSWNIESSVNWKGYTWKRDREGWELLQSMWMNILKGDTLFWKGEQLIIILWRCRFFLRDIFSHKSWKCGSLHHM